MTLRQQRVGNLIRNTLGQLLLSKIADPRIDPARTSITRVEVTEDLLHAMVFVSVIGPEGLQSRTIAALQHASGHIQDLMMRQISLRHTPHLEFQLDEKFKNTLETLRIIQEVSEERRQKDEARAEEPPANEEE